MNLSLRVDIDRGRDILALAAPIIVAMVTQTLINVVDTIYVGKLAPTHSIPGQAALGFSLPVYWTIGGFLAAISVGTQATTARRIGETNDEAAGVTLTNALTVGALSAVSFTVIGWYLVPVYFPLLTSDPSVLDIGIPYTRIRILAILPMVVTFAFKGFFDGLGRTRVHMYASLLMNSLNVGLNYVFIFGLGPVPAMHVTGAGIASAVSTAVGLLAMMGWSLLPTYRDRFQYYRLSNLRPAVMWRLIRLSAPSGAGEIVLMAGGLFFLKIVAMLDEQAVQSTLEMLTAYGGAAGDTAADIHRTIATDAAWPGGLLAADWSSALLSSRPPIYTTAAKLILDLLTLSFVTCIGFGQGTATLISQQMGEGNFLEAEKYGWDSVKLGMYVFGAVGIAGMLAPTFFLEILSDDPLVIRAAIPGLRVAASIQMFVAAALILAQAHFGAGNTKFVMIAEGIAHVVCLVPVAWLLAMVFDLDFIGVWIAIAAYVATLAIVFAWKFWEGSWKAIEV